MRNLFDDLFNDFFKDLFNRHNSNNDLLRDYLRMIAEGRAIPLDDEAYSDFNIDENNPDETHYEEKNGLYIKTLIWHTPYGDVTHKTFRDIPFEENGETPSTKEPIAGEKVGEIDIARLQRQLDKAIAEEKYEEAARLRDLITPPAPKKVRKSRAKKKTDTE